MALPGQGFAPGRHPVEGMGKGGFAFGGMTHVGSILCLPSGVHIWPATTVAGITPQTLELAFAEAEAFDFLLIGVGSRFAAPPSATLAALKDAGIRYEIMATSAAAQTYNILLAEDRKVAAALIAVA